MIITVYTDGSCSIKNKIGTGSYGYVITAKHRGKNVIKKHSSKKYVDTTNNRMELKAIIAALENIKPGHKIDIYSDSRYCVDSINMWLPAWLHKDKLPEKQNADLWNRFLDAREHHEERGSTLSFNWVRGHNGHQFNEMADELANAGRLSEGGGVVCKQQN